MIIDTLRPIRFDERVGYFFIHDLDGQVIMVADRPELEGKPLESDHRRFNR